MSLIIVALEPGTTNGVGPQMPPIQSSYDRLSRYYDWLANGSEGPFRQLGLRLLRPAAGETLLEIGAGTGHGLVALSQAAGATGLACGVYLSAGMCRVAAARLRAAGVREGALLAHGDALRLPFPSARFDAVFMSFTLELFGSAEMGGVMAECRRVLREDGRVGVVALDQAEPANWMTRLYGWAHRRFPTWVDCRPIPVEEILSRHGFRPIAAAAGKMWGLPVKAVVARTMVGA